MQNRFRRASDDTTSVFTSNEVNTVRMILINASLSRDAAAADTAAEQKASFIQRTSSCVDVLIESVDFYCRAVFTHTHRHTHTQQRHTSVYERSVAMRSNRTQFD